MLLLFLSCTDPITLDTAPSVQSNLDVESFFLSVGNESNDQERYDALASVVDDLPEDEFKEEFISFLSVYDQWISLEASSQSFALGTYPSGASQASFVRLLVPNPSSSSSA